MGGNAVAVSNPAAILVTDEKWSFRILRTKFFADDVSLNAARLEVEPPYGSELGGGNKFW